MTHAPGQRPGVPLRVFLSGLILLSLLPLLLMGAWLAWDSQRSALAVQEESARGLASNFMTAMDEYLDARMRSLDLLAATPMLDDPERWSEFYELAQSFQRRFDGHVILAEAMEPRQMLLNTRAPLDAQLPMLPRPAKHSSVATALALGKPAVGDIVFGPVIKEPLVTIAVPVLRQDHVVFVLLSTFTTRLLQERADQFVLPSEWIMHLRDGSGNTIVQRLPPGSDTEQGGPPPRRFVVRSAVGPWFVEVEIPHNVWLSLRLQAGIPILFGVLATTIFGMVGAKLAGNRLQRAVVSLVGPPPDMPAARIAEIEEARELLASTQADLTHSELYFRRLFENAPAALALSNQEGGIISRNTRFDELTGYSAFETPTWNDWWSRVCPESDLHVRIMADWETMVTHLDASPVEQHIRRKNGMQRIVQVFSARFNDGLLSSFLDVTDLRHAQNELRTRHEAKLEQQAVMRVALLNQMQDADTARKQAETALEALRASHAKLQKVLDVQNVGVMFWDLTAGVMTDANDAFLSLMGYSRDELKNRSLTWQELTPPEFYDVSLAEVEKFWVTGRVGPYEKQYLRKDGTRLWLVFAGSALSENACVEFCVDISDRKKVEASLHATNQRLAAFLRVSQAISSSFERQAVMQLLVDNAVKAMNLTNGAIYLRENENIRLAAASPVLPEDFPEHFRRASLHDHPHIARTLSSGGPIVMPDVAVATLTPQEADITQTLGLQSLLYLPVVLRDHPVAVLILADATQIRIFHEEEISLLHGFAHQVAHVLDNIRLYEDVRHHAVQLEQEIGQRQEAEEALRRLNLELEERVRQRTLEMEEANKQLEAFSYSVSHDLRAPLRGVAGLTRILIDKHGPGLSEEGRKLCAMISDNAASMGKLIDDLLEFSRTGRKILQISFIDMTAMAQAVIKDLVATEGAERVAFQVEDLPPAVADPSLIRQVWTNLLANAVKFSSKKENPVVQIGANRNEDGHVVYHVRDNGAGFDMTYGHKLFGIFTRLHPARDFAGTGVGLAIVRQIVLRHGGQVWAQGEPDKGAVFSFTLGGGHYE